MTLNEAFKKLERTLEGDSRCCHPERYDAIKLGGEAILRIQTLRQDLRISPAAPLPSETNDQPLHSSLPPSYYAPGSESRWVASLLHTKPPRLLGY